MQEDEILLEAENTEPTDSFEDIPIRLKNIEESRKEVQIENWKIWYPKEQKYIDWLEAIDKSMRLSKNYHLPTPDIELMQSMIKSTQKLMEEHNKFELFENESLMQDIEKSINYARKEHEKAEELRQKVLVAIKENQELRKVNDDLDSALRMLINNPDKIPEIKDKISPIQVKGEIVPESEIKQKKKERREF